MTTLSARTMNQAHPSSGARLVSSCGKKLSLRHTSLCVQAAAGFCEVVLKQHYINPFDEPLRVHYEVPIPSDAAIGGFAFLVDGQKVVGCVKAKQAAREAFERALIQGQTAALMEQQSSTVFRQEVGNIPPRAELVCELRLDQKLRWLEEGKWEWRFPTVIAPRYQGASAPTVDQQNLVAVDLERPNPSGSLKMHLEDPIDGHPHSPSHALVCRREGPSTLLYFGEEPSASDPLNRDCVIVWRPKSLAEEIQLEQGFGSGEQHQDEPIADDAYGLLTLTPNSEEPKKPVARELIVLLDTSGSMAGAPLAQAKRITRALVESLNQQDQLELVEFSWRARRWKERAQYATSKAQADALGWIDSLEAGGGTEMHEGICEAMRCLNPKSQRQIVLISDGLIGFETEVIREIANNLPNNARFFTVGVGSAVNRSLTGPAARAGRGSEFIAGLNDDATVLAQRIVARTSHPQVVDLTISGSALLQCTPEQLPDLYTGCPLQVALRLKAEGGALEVRGRSEAGAWRRRIEVPASKGKGQDLAIQRLFAREWVEDLEMRRAMGASNEKQIEEIGLRYQIATGQTSWVAVQNEHAVDPTAATRHQHIGQALPHGMNAAALGLRPASLPMRALGMVDSLVGGAMPPAAQPAPFPAAMPPPPGGPAPRSGKARFSTGAPPPPPAPAPARHLQSFGAYAEEEPEAEMPEEGETFSRQPKRSLPQPPHKEPRLLHGQLLLLDENMLVIEIELAQPMRWEPGTIHALLADGQRIELLLQPNQSTRFGLHGAGQRLRLSLRNHQGRRPQSIDLRIAGRLHRILINQAHD